MAETHSAEKDARHCHADGAGPCLAEDCPIAGMGPLVIRRGRWLRPCPGAPGTQHAASVIPPATTTPAPDADSEAGK
jgi:hypothetical protein